MDDGDKSTVVRPARSARTGDASETPCIEVCSGSAKGAGQPVTTLPFSSLFTHTDQVSQVLQVMCVHA